MRRPSLWLILVATIIAAAAALPILVAIAQTADPPQSIDVRRPSVEHASRGERRPLPPEDVQQIANDERWFAAVAAAAAAPTSSTTTTTAAPKRTPARRAPARPVTGGDVWAALARCESGGNAADNTGNGYYGAFQFSEGTWRSVGGTGLPSDASYDEQLARAQTLQARSGWGQWPACSRALGLR